MFFLGITLLEEKMLSVLIGKRMSALERIYYFSF